jgi:phosphotransferase system  glucose/maltose/N-acetylglucosamine-specific IIC component
MILMSDNTGPFGGVDLVQQIFGKVSLVGDSAKLGFHPLFGNKYNAVLSQNVLNGILVGMFVAYIYNKFSGLELPSILGFFSGRRLIPILAILSGLVIGIIYAIIFP